MVRAKIIHVHICTLDFAEYQRSCPLITLSFPPTRNSQYFYLQSDKYVSTYDLLHIYDQILSKSRLLIKTSGYKYMHRSMLNSKNWNMLIITWII